MDDVSTPSTAPVWTGKPVSCSCGQSGVPTLVEGTWRVPDHDLPTSATLALPSRPCYGGGAKVSPVAAMVGAAYTGPAATHDDVPEAQGLRPGEDVFDAAR